MAQPLMIETGEIGEFGGELIFFMTIKTFRDELWFVNNPELVAAIELCLAICVNKYGAKLYVAELMGNHLHLVVSFPRHNKAQFKRHFYSQIALITKRLCPAFRGGKLWGRRGADQILPLRQDVLHWFFYTVLNPVSSALVPKISGYKGFKFFHAAATGKTISYKVFNKTDFNNRKRHNSKLKEADCTETITLELTRLPGFESMSQKDYRAMLLEQLEARRLEAVQKVRAEGKTFAGEAVLDSIEPGASPKDPKSGGTPPIVLSTCAETRKAVLEWYKLICAEYRHASIQYRAGGLGAVFPPGTHRPPILCSRSVT